MDVRQLKHLTAVVDCGSFSSAAAKVGISQSGLTKSIRVLEDALRSKLVERLPSGVRPTLTGVALVNRARSIIALAEEAANEVSALQNGGAGMLSIGAGPSWMRRGLPEAVAELTRLAPRAKLRVVGGFDSQLVRALKDGELDLVIAACEAAGHDETLVVEELTVDRQSIIARSDHPLASRINLSIGDLRPYSWILPRTQMAQRERFSAIFVNMALQPPEPLVESDSIAFILATLRNTNLLSFATESIASEENQAGLRRLDVPELTWNRKAGLIYRSGEARSALSEALGKMLHSASASLVAN